MGTQCCEVVKPISDIAVCNNENIIDITEDKIPFYFVETINKGINYQYNYDDARFNIKSIQDFDSLSLIGIGGFSKVKKVKLKNTDHIYALKVIDKSKAYNSNFILNILTEKTILLDLNFPFISRLQFSFDDLHSSYMGFDYYENGDLRKYLRLIKRIDEDELSKDFLIRISRKLYYSFIKIFMFEIYYSSRS